MEHFDACWNVYEILNDVSFGELLFIEIWILEHFNNKSSGTRLINSRSFRVLMCRLVVSFLLRNLVKA